MLLPRRVSRRRLRSRTRLWGDSHAHAAEVGDWPDRPHGHAEAVGASHGLVVLARELTEFACEWYESADDDMFFGNCVTAYGTLVDGVRVVKMAG